MMHFGVLEKAHTYMHFGFSHAYLALLGDSGYKKQANTKVSECY